MVLNQDQFFEYGPAFSNPNQSPQMEYKAHRDASHRFGALGVDPFKLDRAMEKHGYSKRPEFGAMTPDDYQRSAQDYYRERTVAQKDPRVAREDLANDPALVRQYRNAEGKDVGLRGSQGTLFRAKPEARTPESRQPRGYSPQRYKDVTEALGITHVSGEYRRRMAKAYTPDKESSMSGAGTALQTYPGHAETLARAAASVARSTIPLRDIVRPDPSAKASADNPGLSMGVSPRSERNEGELAHYSNPELVAGHDRGSISLVSGRAHSAEDPPDAVALHEIGHHVDYVRGVRHIGMIAKGEGEGFADAYAQEHGRTRGYKQKPIEVEHRPQDWHRSYGMTTEDVSAHERFDKGYNTARPIQPAQFDFIEDTKRALGAQTYPKHHHPDQQALLPKTASFNTKRYKKTDPEYTDIRWAYPDWVQGH